MSDTASVGIHADIPESIYHADRRSLSQSGAKLLLQPSCPAKFKHAMDNPPTPKPQFDFGSAAHTLVLGKGTEIVEVDAIDWKTKAAREARDQAHADGKTPLLVSDAVRAYHMARVVRQHPVAGPLFLDGHAEVSLYADDPDTGVRLRGRADWITDLNGRMAIVDYKTCLDADPKSWGRTSHKFGYQIQFAWYFTLARLLELDDSPAFLHVAQEKTPPYLVSVNELDGDAYKLGREQMQLAIALYAECVESGVWPGYPDTINPISLPPWAFRSNQPTIGELLEESA